MGKVNGYSCCVPLCPYYRGKCPPNTEWFSFPREEKYKKIWLVKIRRDIGKNFQLTKSTRICSHHFLPFDKFPRNSLGKLPRLKMTAVPSIFPWTNQENKAVQRESRLTQRSARQNTAVQTQSRLTQRSTRKKMASQTEETEATDNGETDQCLETQPSEPSTNWHDDKMELQNQIKKLEAQIRNLQYGQAKLLEENNGLKDENSSLKKENASLKGKFLKTQKRILCYENIRNDNKLVKFYTGLPSALWFNDLLKYLHPKYNSLNYWKGNKTNLNANIKKSRPGLPSKLSPRNMLFLVFVRLRLGMPVVEISRMFGITQSSVTKIFTTWITFLYFELKELFPIPPIPIIRRACPEQFADYPNTTLLIDCCELRVQKPSKLRAQRETFSNYKHYNTYKFMLAITPGGLVCFVSELFGGSKSDKKIVTDSKFLDMLCPGHEIMADKGFDISDILPVGIKCNVPPKFMKQRDGQMPLADVLKTRKIATVRVHVERSISRMKTYRILSSTLPLSMRNLADQVVTVCAYLTNFKPALLKNTS